MSRFVSAWLPRWPILRFLAAQAQNPKARNSKARNSLSRERPIDPERPFVLAAEATGGPRIAAANAAAEALRINIGDGVSDARAKAQFLQVEAAEPKSDAVALEHLALWATRYTPSVAPFDEENGADGFFLDITGAASLFGGEEKLVADLSHRLERFGLSPRLAVADTQGMAWALSRFHPSPRFILPSADANLENKALAAKALADLPIGALRLAPATRKTLRRLGFKRIGALIDAPRAPFAARFEAELLRRLDQALGRVPEPLVFLAPPPVYRKIIHLIEPVFTQDAIVALAKRLMRGIIFSLRRDGVGARQLRLTLYRVDGEVFGLDLGLAMPTRDFEHVARLIALKLERLGSQEPMPSRGKPMRSGKDRGFPQAPRKAGKVLPEAIDFGLRLRGGEPRHHACRTDGSAPVRPYRAQRRQPPGGALRRAHRRLAATARPAQRAAARTGREPSAREGRDFSGRDLPRLGRCVSLLATAREHAASPPSPLAARRARASPGLDAGGRAATLPLARRDAWGRARARAGAHRRRMVARARATADAGLLPRRE